MAKRNFASLLLIAVTGISLAPAASFAQPATGNVDGCTILAELVYTQVVSSGLSRPGGFAALPETLRRDRKSVV